MPNKEYNWAKPTDSSWYFGCRRWYRVKRVPGTETQYAVTDDIGHERVITLPSTRCPHLKNPLDQDEEDLFRWEAKAALEKDDKALVGDLDEGDCFRMGAWRYFIDDGRKVQSFSVAHCDGPQERYAHREAWYLGRNKAWGGEVG